MIRITDKMSHLLFDEEERYTLRKELEDVFCSMDKKRKGMCYSLKTIYKISPNLARLYSELGK